MYLYSWFSKKITYQWTHQITGFQQSSKQSKISENKLYQEAAEKSYLEHICTDELKCKWQNK